MSKARGTVSADDRVLAARVVDQIERGIRRDGVTDQAEADRRLRNGCPWQAQIEAAVTSAADPRWGMYQREVVKALARLYGPRPAPVPVDVEAGARLAMVPELEAWARRQRVEVRGTESAEHRPAEGPETLDMFADGAA